MNGTENTVPQEENIDDTKNVQQSTITLDPNARVFTLTGVNFGYDVQEIVVQEGDTVTINFESTDGLHDVIIDEFAVATKRVQPGVKTSVTFVADKKGTFEYYCSVGQHRSKGMVGKLIVE
jgi:plastocyanin